MWPWEHAAVAYIAYSLLQKLTTQHKPDAVATIAVLIGSQLPDLVDKPLAWWLQLLPSGRSLGHSLFFGVPLCALALVFAHHRRRTDVGIAFAIGYLSHLPGDVFYPILLGDDAEFGFLLYPVVPREGTVESGVIEKLSGLLVEFLGFLGTQRGLAYLGGELLLIGVALWLWVWDGKPGVGLCRRGIRRAMTG